MPHPRASIEGLKVFRPETSGVFAGSGDIVAVG
jgi:hypothetical protein